MSEDCKCCGQYPEQETETEVMLCACRLMHKFAKPDERDETISVTVPRDEWNDLCAAFRADRKRELAAHVDEDKADPEPSA